MTATTEHLDCIRLLSNRTRIARSELHQAIAGMSTKGGRQHAARLIEDPPEFLLTLPLRKFLGWIDRWGDVKVDLLLEELGIGQRHDVTVGELVPRQVSLLTDALLDGRR